MSGGRWYGPDEIFETTVGSDASLVYLLLCRATEGKRRAKPGDRAAWDWTHAQIAGKLGMSPRAVRRALVILKTVNMVTWSRGHSGRRLNSYHPLPPSVWTAEAYAQAASVAVCEPEETTEQAASVAARDHEQAASVTACLDGDGTQAASVTACEPSKRPVWPTPGTTATAEAKSSKASKLSASASLRRARVPRNGQNGKHDSAEGEPEPFLLTSPEAGQGESETGPTWKAYADAWEKRWKVRPTASPRGNKHLVKFIAEVGRADAPAIAAHYVASPEDFFVRRKHPVSCLETEAQKLRAEWLRGDHGSATAAREGDALQARGARYRGVIEELRAEERER